MKGYWAVFVIATSLVLLLVSHQSYVFAHNDQLIVSAGDTIDGKTLTEVDQPSINDNGEIVFRGFYPGGTGTDIGIFTPDSFVAGTDDTIDGKTLSFAVRPAIKDNGDIVFQGFIAPGDAVGIFTPLSCMSR